MKRTFLAVSILLLVSAVASCSSDRAVADRSEANMNRRAMTAMGRDTVRTGAASHRSADVELTRKIREKLMADDRLSVFAQNITIVTLGDTVTLKGEVRNAAESRKVSSLAREVAKDKHINNQLVLTK
jgi:osmotically-inducible protein OsmY